MEIDLTQRGAMGVWPMLPATPEPAYRDLRLFTQNQMNDYAIWYGVHVYDQFLRAVREVAGEDMVARLIEHGH